MLSGCVRLSFKEFLMYKLMQKKKSWNGRFLLPRIVKITNQAVYGNLLMFYSLFCVNVAGKTIDSSLDFWGEDDFTFA